MTACRHTRALLERAFEGSLSIDERFRVEEHNTSCERCRAAWEQHDALLDALAAQPAPPLERLDADRFVRAVRATLDERELAAEPAPRARRFTPWIPAAAAAALLAYAFYPDAAEEDLARDVVLHVPVDPPPQDTEPRDLELAVGFAPTDFDAARHTAALAEVRGALLRASAGAELLDREPSWIADFDADTARLARDWPVAALVRRLLSDDADARVGTAAARVVGLRGGRLAGAALERALDRPDRAHAAIAALFDVGAGGERALARAWWRADLQPLLRARLEQAGGDPSLAVPFVERALAAGPRQVTREVQAAAGGLLELLQGADVDGARALLELGVDERFERAQVLACLERTPAAVAALVELLENEDPRRRLPPEAYLLDVAARLHPAGALAWVAERTRTGTQRARAARALAAFPGTAALALLVDLEGSGGLRGRDFLDVWDLAVMRDDDSLRALAWQTLDGGQRTAARAYMELLLLSERSEVLPAALVLAGSDLLSDAQRREALLAAGERGDAAHLTDLTWTFDQLERDELQLASAATLAAWRIGGAAAVRDLLRVDELLLARVTARLEDAPASGPARAVLYQLIHELEPVYDSRESELRGTNQ